MLMSGENLTSQPRVGGGWVRTKMARKWNSNKPRIIGVSIAAETRQNKISCDCVDCTKKTA